MNYELALHHEHYYHLCYDYSDEHSKRIHRCVCHGSAVAGDGVVGVAQCHWVGHGAAEESTDGAEVEFA